MKEIILTIIVTLIFLFKKVKHIKDFMDKISFYLKENYILLTVLVISTVLRIYHIDFQSLWVDEINTMVQATPNQSFKDTYKSLLANDLQPPLYFYILKYLFRIFGYTTLVMRLFSAILGVAAVWGIYLLGKEIFSKKAGLISSAILGLNFFHIYYSQEGRPYSFLVLFTIFSFYMMCRYLKSQSYKIAFFHGILACLMLYGHPFGLFALLSQYLILFYYFILYDKQRKLTLIKHSAISVITTFVLYVPAIPLLMSAAKVDSFWIDLPGANIFTYILGQYFGASELILALVYLALILFFIKLFDEKSNSNHTFTLKNSNYIQSYVILIPWIVICIIIPLIRSYLKVPMIIPRYLIVALPAVILIVSIGILQIKHILVKLTFFGLFITFSFIDIFILKDFYNKSTKTDFRGITEYVTKNIKSEDELVSRIGWHYSYFFNNSIPKKVVLWNTIEAYVSTMIKWPDNYKHPFWFVDAQDAPLTLSTEASLYLNNHFYIHCRKDLFQALAIHYVYKDKNYFRPQFPEQPQFNGADNNLIELASNITIKSAPLTLEKGMYKLLLSSKSLPEKPINNINAHITVKVNNKIVGGFFANEKQSISTEELKFYVENNKECVIELIYDNNYTNGNNIRKAVIYSVYFEKINLIDNK